MKKDMVGAALINKGKLAGFFRAVKNLTIVHLNGFGAFYRSAGT